MSVEILILFSIIILVIFLFALEVFPIDKIAFLIMVSLLVFDLVSPEEAISGFSSPATITVLALMIIAIGLEENGVINWLTQGLKKLKGLPLYLMVPVFMFIAGGISAFINTTAVVLVFVKIINELSARFNIQSSKLLLPISFAGIAGGSCTLMGTSTNLIVNAEAMNRGVERFSFFEFTWLGVIFLFIIIGVVSILARFLPQEADTNFSEDYDLDEFITKIIIPENSRLIDKSLEDVFAGGDKEIVVIRQVRNGVINEHPSRESRLRSHDVLFLQCNIEQLVKLRESRDVLIIKETSLEERDSALPGSDISQDSITVVEILMLPNSPLIGKSMKDVSWQDLQGAIPLAIRKRRSFRNPKHRIYGTRNDEIELRVGDRLLVESDREALEHLKKMDSVTILQQFSEIDQSTRQKRNLSFGILLLVIVLSAFSIFPILKSALIGCFLLIIFKCIDLGKIYSQVNWQVIFLLAGMIPLGVAMTNTGADQWLTNRLLDVLHDQSNMIIMGLVFLVTMLLSGFVSNNATAIIITPIAITIAGSLNMDPKPFILAVLFASNYSFFTPVGYQTNTIIYGMGIYRFRHFFIIGGVVSLVLWIAATFLLSGQL